MAKRKQQHDEPPASGIDAFDAAIPAPPDAVEPSADFPPLSSEEDVIAENARLKAELATMKEAALASEAKRERTAERATRRTMLAQKYRVTLQHGPDWVVSAYDPANAWEAYKAATGVLRSEYAPEVSAMPPETPLGRYTAPPVEV